jgi:hypothetical protein
VLPCNGATPAPAATDENPIAGKMLCLNDTLSSGILFNNNLAFQPTNRPAGGSKSAQQTRPPAANADSSE